MPSILAMLEASPIEPFVQTLARLAADDPDFVAISCEDDQITRAMLEARTASTARAYAALGVTEGAFVTIALPNGIDWFVAFIATLKIGRAHV